MLKTLCYLIVLSGLLSACSIFSPVKVEPTTTYEINATPTVKTAKRSSITLFVPQPQTNSIYNTPFMAYTTRPYEIGYFVKSRWIEPPAQMLQPLIIKTLENTHHFRNVSAYSSLGPYDYTLNTRLLTLQEDYTKSPYAVHFALKAEIINNNKNTLIAAKTFSVVEPLPQNTPYGGVIAANQATAALLQQLTQFCLSHL